MAVPKNSPEYRLNTQKATTLLIELIANIYNMFPIANSDTAQQPQPASPQSNMNMGKYYVISNMGKYYACVTSEQHG